MGQTNDEFPSFLDRVVDFPEGRLYEILRPLTDFRKCHDGTPAEARIVVICRLMSPSSQHDAQEEFVMKIKVQVPGDPSREPEAGPSTTTSAELNALETFAGANNPSTPHLLAWKRAEQGPNGLLPGGYITYTIMTKMPGRDLLNLRFWSMPAEVRQEIVRRFLEALRTVYDLGIEPRDCALRNVLWEQETQRCTIIDFELWQATTETISVVNETKELEKWGLARRPPPRTWWDAWKLQEH